MPGMVLQEKEFKTLKVENMVQYLHFILCKHAAYRF